MEKKPGGDQPHRANIPKPPSGPPEGLGGPRRPIDGGGPVGGQPGPSSQPRPASLRHGGPSSPSGQRPSFAVSNAKVRRGPYSKGFRWKWASRMAGGTAGWMLIGIIAGSAAIFFFFFFVGAIACALLSFSTGLASNPDEKGKPASPPMAGGLMGASFRFQDRVGDVLLTFIWNQVRNFSDYRIQ